MNIKNLAYIFLLITAFSCSGQEEYLNDRTTLSAEVVAVGATNASGTIINLKDNNDNSRSIRFKPTMITSEFLDLIEVGDSIIKTQNSINSVYLVKSDTVIEIYYSLPYPPQSD